MSVAKMVAEAVTITVFSDQEKSQIVKDEEAVATPAQPMKITDVNTDCLEKAFAYLDAIDLFNLADSNTWLREGAQLAFQKYKMKTVELYDDVLCGFEIKGGILQIEGLKNQLLFLRYFGHSVFTLNIWYDSIASDKRHYLNQYIKEYCADTLIHIKVYDGDENTFKSWEKPFANVERVSIHGRKMCDMIEDLNKWFPKMNHLELYSIKKNDSDFEKLEIAIRSNPQLRILKIGNYWSNSIFQCIGDLPHLETIEIYWVNEFVEHLSTDDIRINLVNVKQFCIRSAKIFPAKMIPFTFDKLKELSVPMVDLNDFVDYFVIHKHSSINKLTMGLWNDGLDEITEKDLERLKEVFPSLKELILNECKLSIDEAVLFTNVLTSLETFCFRLSTDNDYYFDGETNDGNAENPMEVLLRQLGSKWQGTYIDKWKRDIKMERKSITIQTND